MKPLLIACASVAAWAVVACGCSSGDAGPAGSPFDPFAVETAPKNGAEPTISGLDEPPGRSGLSIPQLCQSDCARIAATCPGAVQADCAPSCTASAQSVPACAVQFQAYLACVSTAPLVCSTGSVQIPSCSGAASTITTCVQANRA